MAIIKCPRCDINFIREQEQFCQICKREMRGETKQEEMPEMCIECGENPALPGEDLCSACLLDKKLAEEVAAGADNKDDERAPNAVMDSAEIDMNTIDVATRNDDIPEKELEVIHKELSFDELEEEEEEKNDDDKDENEDDLGF